MKKVTRKPAAGLHGCIIGGSIFRVYHADKSFTDYDLLVDDLFVTIDPNEMAELVEIDNKHYKLDYSASVLGLTTTDEDK